LPVAINPASLATIGAEDFAGTLPDAPFTGHPTHDPRTGALVFFGYGANDFSDTIRIGELSRSGGLIRLEQAFAPYAVIVQDFAVTDRFVAIPLFPLIEWTWQPKRGA